MPDEMSNASPQPLTPADREYQLTRLRIEKSAAYVGKMIWAITLIAAFISIIVVVSVVLFAVLKVTIRAHTSQLKFQMFCRTCVHNIIILLFTVYSRSLTSRV